MPHRITRRTVLQKVRGCAYIALPQLVDTGFQVLFHSPPGVLFTFPSRYWSTIAHQGVFSLSRWSSILPSGFLVSRRTQGLPRLPPRLRIREFHPLRCAFPCASPVMSNRLYRHPYNPIIRWFGLLRFRSPLLTESFLLSFPAGTEMFQFPAYRLDSSSMSSSWMTGSPIRTSTGPCMLTARRRVSPFAASFFASWWPGIRHTLFFA